MRDQDLEEVLVRGKTKARKKHLEQAGWVIVEERAEHGDNHLLVLHHLHGHRNIRTPDEARAYEVQIEASTRPLAYLRAERELIRKEGRKRQPILE